MCIKLLNYYTVHSFFSVYIILYEKIFSVANYSLQVSSKRKNYIKITILSITVGSNVF